jgi:catalase
MDDLNSPPALPATAQSIIDILYRKKDGDRDKRPVHAIGISVAGYFKASEVAPLYSKAAHFQPHPEGHRVTVRFSNGSGCKDPHDNWSDVRGMATRFTLPAPKPAENAYTDLIAMTLPEFFSSTPDEFQEFAWAARPTDYVAERPWRKFLDMLKLTMPLRPPYPNETISPDLGAMDFADKNDIAKPGVLGAASIGAPVSYLRAAYHAVHTFIVTNQQGVQRPVRFSWQPAMGVKNLADAAPYETDPAPGNGDEYLQDELRHTLVSSIGKDHPRFTLMMTLGEAGDALNDPSRAWPPHRTRIMMGTLSIEHIVPDPEEWEKISFNPGLLTDGIAMSDDKVLKFRVETYKLSSEQRNAHPCPFSGAMNDDTQG